MIQLEISSFTKFKLKLQWKLNTTYSNLSATLTSSTSFADIPTENIIQIGPQKESCQTWQSISKSYKIAHLHDNQTLNTTWNHLSVVWRQPQWWCLLGPELPDCQLTEGLYPCLSQNRSSRVGKAVYMWVSTWS